MLILTASLPVDIVAAYAPALAETCAASTPSCIAIFSRCMTFFQNGVHHRVLRQLASDKDLALGNHWVIGMKTTDGPGATSFPPHYPCGGAGAGTRGGSCTSPLTESLASAGFRPLPTAEQGDCGLDVMVFWDGDVRSAQSWKALRLELDAAVGARVADPVWHGIFLACAEGPHLVVRACTRTESLAPRAALKADVTLPVPRGSPPQEDVHAAATAAVMYFCGMCGAGAAEGAARIAIEMAPVEREQLVLKHARSLASEQIAVRPARAWNAKRRRNRAPPIPVRRAQGQLLLNYCAQGKINITMKPLPSPLSY